MKTNQTIIRLNAGNDRNGNPRRVFVHLVAGMTRAVYDEGYRGTAAIPENLRALYKGETFLTTPAQRQELLKTFGGQNV